MGPGRGRYPWFWTAERVENLTKVLNELALKDDNGLYFGPPGLAESVYARRDKIAPELSKKMVNLGLSLLVYTGVLEASRHGNGKNYRRRYWPEKLPITPHTIQMFRQHRKEK